VSDGVQRYSREMKYLMLRLYHFVWVPRYVAAVVALDACYYKNEDFELTARTATSKMGR
jgi:hypothetical protein